MLCTEMVNSGKALCFFYNIIRTVVRSTQSYLNLPMTMIAFELQGTMPVRAPETDQICDVEGVFARPTDGRVAREHVIF